MAATDFSTLTTGTSPNEADLRRRNVATFEKANGVHGVHLEAEDIKKLKQKVLYNNSRQC